MKRVRAASLAVLVCVAASGARASAGRFFLLEASEPPEPGFIAGAYREAQRTEPTLIPEEARQVLGSAFPRLFGSGRTVDRNAIDADLKAARGAHFAGQFQEAEEVFARALGAVEAQPEILATSSTLLQRLADAAALRYTNSLARKRPAAEARAQILGFLDRYPFAQPTPSEHPPEVIQAWAEVREAHRKGFGSIVVNVHPRDLERSGTCRLHLNGAEVAELPMPGPLEAPKAEHLVQVRCGPQTSWLMRVALGERPVALVVPVRAMLSARGDATTGGVVLVEPGDGDAAALVDAVSQATGLSGAVVARTAVAKVQLGRWEAGMAGPSVESVGTIRGAEIIDVKAVDRQEESGGRVATWVVGGVGLAALAGAVGTNLAYEDERQGGASEDDLSGLRTASTALYIGAGALIVTSVVLFFVEDDGEQTAWKLGSPAPGAIAVHF